MRNIFLSILVFSFFLIIGFFLSSDKNISKTSLSRSEIIMGTLVEIKLEDVEEIKAEQIIEGAFNEIKRVDSLFSNHIITSEVNKFNKSKDSILYLKPEVYNLIKISDSLRIITHGAFDIGLNKVLKLWGFTTLDYKIPTSEEVQEGVKSSGTKQITFEDNGLIKNNNVELNLGAIAKGYAIDKACAYLKKNNVEKAFINAGGEIKVLGDDWIIGIQHPRNPEEVIMKLKISNKAIATSGDYENYFEISGKRYNHIINPQNGYPADQVQSVTIISDEDWYSDALSTAVFVLGVNEGLKLINNIKDAEAVIIDSSGKIFYSDKVSKLVYK